MEEVKGYKLKKNGIWVMKKLYRRIDFVVGWLKKKKMFGNFLIKIGKIKVIIYWNIFIEINLILSY